MLAAYGYDTIRLLKKVLSGEEIRTRRDLAKALLGSQGFGGFPASSLLTPKGKQKWNPFY